MAASAQAAGPVSTVAFQARNTNERLVALKVPNLNLANVKTANLVGSLAAWDLFTSSNGVSVIAKNRATGLCLDTNNGGTGTLVAARPCDGTLSQDWNLDVVSGGSFKMIRNSFTGKYLTKFNSNQPSLAGFNGSTNQHWIKTP
ncbi:RICIN domain-containing protein [Micromonospora sp. NPDC051141]|uniref:RICIN domain-containing protein n=1 Tax=Micromonospora sp. NPDC051141 TaxID=3364284 RepID=UPI0037B5E5BF